MIKKTIALIPIDNRPVCYDLPKQIVDITDEYELLMPPIEAMGGLVKAADRQKLIEGLKNLPECDYIVLSLDTLVWGGLINSRRSSETFDEILPWLEEIKNILKTKKAKILAFSSVMRISNNNFNEEEKEYWSEWGKKIFDWSYNFHLARACNDNEPERKQNCIMNKIPDEILNDYLSTRERNFKVNKIYLEWLKEGIFDFLVFSKDDCAKYGLNVMEAEELSDEIKKSKLNAAVKTGADEIPLTLMARIFSEKKQTHIFPVYTQPESVDKISKYEDLPVKLSVNSQIELAGCTVAEDIQNAELVLLVNNFKNEQGELVMNVFEEGFKGDFDVFDKPFAIADILNANGADNDFVETLFKKDWKNLVGYAGWNTTGNTLGSVIALSLAYLLSERPNSENHKKVLFTRFCDDWAYQANVRAELKKENSFAPDEKMQPYTDKINKKLNTKIHGSYSFPWNRFFEIEVRLG